ncbi:MAG: hypothetical protein K0R54_4690 [Clostridiaceae bacterium]|jgi:histidine triad (HIT) family protein|nr:hypothetical protein [Clostridiaceae bacterium]
MEDCLFCKIAKGEIPSTKVYEDNEVLAFKDINPEAPIHFVIIPKKHIASLNELKPEDGKIISHIFMVIQKLAKDFQIDEKGYRVVNNCGEYGGQSVLHMHFHLLGGRSLNWPPG